MLFENGIEYFLPTCSFDCVDDYLWIRLIFFLEPFCEVLNCKQGVLFVCGIDRREFVAMQIQMASDNDRGVANDCIVSELKRKRIEKSLSLKY